MGFGFSASEPPSTTIVDTVRLLALEAFRRNGVPVELSGTTTLSTADGGKYPLDNIIERCRAADRSMWGSLIEKHAHSMAQAHRTPDSSSLPESEFVSMVRERLLAHNFAGNMGGYEYSRPLFDEPGAPRRVLCLDYPDHVAVLADKHLEGREVEALWEAGRANTSREPVDVVKRMAKNNALLEMVSGRSLFIASKVADMRALLGEHLEPSPMGALFAIPNRHEIMVHRVSSSTATVESTPLLLEQAEQRSHGIPGPISPNMFFWRDDTVTQVSDGRVIRAGGPFEATIAELIDSGR